MMKSFIDFIREINLVEFAFHYGYCMNGAKGKKWPVLVNKNIDDTIIIGHSCASSHQYYWNPLNENDRGTIIQFVRNRLGLLFENNHLKKQAENINAVLYGYLKMAVTEKGIFVSYRKIKAKPFDPVSLQALTDAGYLVNQRGISLDTLQDKVFAGTIMQMLQKGFCNIAFPYFDMHESIVGAELCNKGFKAHAAGSDKSNGIWHSNILSSTKHIVIGESGIDALSYHQLKGSHENIYVSVGGHLTQGQINTIASLAEKISAGKIMGAFDNDRAGRKFTQICSERFESFVADVPEEKDFNEDAISGNL